MAEQRICTVPDCGKKWFACGLCGSHYYRLKKHGNLNGGRTAPGEPERFLRVDALAYESDDCLIWPFAMSRSGYGNISVNGSNTNASRFLCEMVHGVPPFPHMEAAHECGNPACVNKRHLSWKTPVENAADRDRHGTNMRGENHCFAKLSEPDVMRIRSMAGKVSQSRLAAEYGVSQSSIYLIQSGKNWRHVP